MVERSHGGSVIQSGTIEVMQHRRLVCKDSSLGSVNEALDETQPDGRGIAVNTKYYLTFSDADISSMQRRTQLLKDEPLQVFYTTDFTVKDASP